MITRLYGAVIHGSNEQGEYCSSSSEAMYRMNRDINSLLYFYFYTCCSKLGPCMNTCVWVLRESAQFIATLYQLQ